ncbi:MAG: flagellar export protein FliJ [Comamonas sp.]
MPETTPLDTLITRAGQRTDDALQALGLAQRRCTQARQQLGALSDYRHDYQSRLQDAMATGLDTGRYRNYVSFLDSLDQAIAQQQGVLDSAQQQFAQCQRQWIEEKRALEAYATLAQRRARQASVIAQRREQKTLDEYAQRLHARHAERARAPF